MSQLHVVDMSPAIYAGSFNRHSIISGDVVKTADGWRERYIPTGGASMLFNILAQYYNKGDIAFVADRYPAIKKEMYPNYKGSRVHQELVSVSKDVAEFILQDCGFTIHAREGYEADDVVANIVDANHDKYDEIFVHTADSDLYLLVDEKVSILPTSSQAKEVTLENYAYTVKRGQNIAYNTLVFNKFLHGDPGKDIPGMHNLDIEYCVAKLCPTPAHYKKLGNWKFMRYLVSRLCPKYYDRFQLFYPLPIDEPWEISAEGNPTRIKEWAYEIRNRKIPGKKGDLSAQIEAMMQQSLYLED